MPAPLPQPVFLPMSRGEMDRLGWDAVDVLLISGDAYVDHPAFAPALLGRWLVANGYRVGIVAQPDWAAPDAAAGIARLGRPRLLAGIAPGAVDSMLAHYTAFRKLRRDDAYTPGGRHGARPNRATLVYAGLARRAFPGLPVVAGGIEASLRRASHYDFWEDKLRRPIVLDAKVDAVLYGMAETSLLELVRRLDARAASAAPSPAPDGPARAERPPPSVFALRGSCFAVTPPRPDASPPTGLSRWTSDAPPSIADADANPDASLSTGLSRWPPDAAFRAAAERWGVPADAPMAELPSHEDLLARPALLLEAARMAERHVHEAADTGAWLVQRVGDRAVLTAPPAPFLGKDDFDALYALPFARAAHPSYREPVPALAMVRDSLTSHRGCGGGCSFCGLALHQGRRVRSRSAASIVDEAARLAASPGWHGSVSDVGGPSANMWGAACRLPAGRACRRESCLWPHPCRLFDAPGAPQIAMLRRVKAVPGVRHVRVASGVRYDLALKQPDYLRALAAEFTGGQLKVAPEHCADGTLRRMRKPPFAESFPRFVDEFARASAEAGREQYVVPYFMSAFPGTTDADMDALADWLAARGWSPQQVQCFIPTPGTAASAMYYAGVDESGAPIPVARTDAERLRQHGRLAPRAGGGARGPGRFSGVRPEKRR